MIFKNEIKVQLEFLQRTERQMQNRLKELPRGRLVIKKAKENYYYYEEKYGKMRSLLNHPQLKNAYLEKRDIEKELGKVKRNLAVMKRLIKEYEPVVTEKNAWNEMKKQQNSYFTANMKHQYKGIYYRSKSELAIAMTLASYGLEFKYEVVIEGPDRRFYPDFAIRRASNGKIFLWEHFGLIGDDEYRENVFEKLQMYYETGYRLWDNLIISFDREDGSISGDYIEKIIKLYLL